jgi:uncharacterized protein GlcG (DUF336 family)
MGGEEGNLGLEFDAEECNLPHEKGVFMYRIIRPLYCAALCGIALSIENINADPVGKDLPTHAQLQAKLKAVIAAGGNAGFALNMWATIVNRDGEVVAVAFTGSDRGDQWPGSRVISAQKANTANAFSLPGLALSTANLYSAVQPEGTLYGLQHSNPVDTGAAYKGPSANYGKPNDPLVGNKIGGVNVFGGGLALYNSEGKLVGAIGVSGDTSCTDHIVAWKVRHALNFDNVPSGVSATGDDNMVHDVADDGNGHFKSPSGWGHPKCDGAEAAIVAALPATHPVGPTP